jgi:hypothetical protein
MANQIAVTLDTNQKTTIRSAPNGALAATLAWAVVSGDVTITPSADGSTCDVISGTTAGSAVISVTDSRISGEVDVTETLAVVAATDLGLTADAAIPK